MLTNAISSFENMRTALYYFGYRDSFNYHVDFLDGSAAPGTVKKLNLEATKEWLPKIFSYRSLSIASVGPANIKQIKGSVEKQSKRIGIKEYVKPNYTPLDISKFQNSELKVSVLNKPAATDNQVLMIFPEQLSFDNKDRAVALIAHQILLFRKMASLNQ